MRYFYLGCCCLLALLLSACASPDSRQTGTPIRIRWARDPEALDPLALPNQHAYDAINLLHLGLLQTDFQTGRNAPALAETLPKLQLVGDSLTRLDYHLRPAATWDNGYPVLATDVDFTLKLMLCPGLPNEVAQPQFSFIRQLRADSSDPRHFVLVCRGQAPEYAWESGEFAILPEYALDPTHSLRSLSLAALRHQPLTAAASFIVQGLAKRYQQADPGHHPERLPGCGAYQLEKWESNSYLLFQRKAKWWADKLHPAPLVLQALPQRLQFTIIPADAAATLALQRQEIDLYAHVPAREFQRLQASPAAQRALSFHSSPSYDLVYAGFNTQQPALHDSLTRQALSCLFDPAGLLAGTQLGQGSRTAGLLPPYSPFYNDSLPLPAYAPAKATALLHQAGWQQVGSTWQRRGMQRLALLVRYRTDEATFQTVALQFRAAAAKLGIPVELRPTEPSALTTALTQGDFDIFVRILKGSSLGSDFAPILHSQAIGQGNFTGFRSATVDNLLTAISTARFTGRKRQLLRRFQAVLRQEVPIAPLFFLSYRLAANRHLSHLLPSSLKPGYAAETIVWTGDAPASAH